MREYMIGLTEKIVVNTNNDQLDSMQELQEINKNFQILLDQLEKFFEYNRFETAIRLYETLVSTIDNIGATTDVAIRLINFSFKLVDYLRSVNKNSIAKSICQSGRTLADTYKLQNEIISFSKLIADLDDPDRHSVIMPSISKDTVGVYKLKLLSKLDNYFEVYRNTVNQDNDTLSHQVMESITKLEVKFLYECSTELLGEYFSCISQEKNSEKILFQQFYHLENFINRLIYLEKYKEARNLYRLVEEGIMKRTKIPAVRKLLVLLLRALHSLGEYELKFKLLSVDITRDWLTYREILQKSRMKFSNGLNSTNVVERQQQFTKEIELLIKIMMEHNYQLIGLPRAIIFNFIASGSISREEISLYSDLECLLLVSQSEMLKRKYLTILLQLLDFKIYCLGESRMPWKGFHLDQGCSPFGHKPEEFSTDNSNTPEYIVQERIKLDKLIDDDGFSYSILKPRLLYQYGDDNHSLFERFQQAVGSQLNNPVTGTFPSVYQEASLQQMERHWYFFLKRSEELNDNSETKDLKEIWLKPFLYICMDLRLFFNLEKNNCLAIIQSLGEKDLLAFSFVKDASNTHRILQTLRCRLQESHQKQDEIFLLPEVSNTVQNSNSRMQLSKQEYQELMSIFYRIIDPLYRLIAFLVIDLSLNRRALIQKLQSINFIDPALSYFKDQVEFYSRLALDSNQLEKIEEKINPIICNLIYTLVYRQAKVNDYLSYYECLTSEFRDSYIKLLEQQAPEYLEEIQVSLKKAPTSLSLVQWRLLNHWDKKHFLKELKDAQQKTKYRYHYKDSVTHNYDGFDLTGWAHDNGIPYGDHVLLPLSLAQWNLPNANLQKLDLSAYVYVGSKKETTNASLENAHFTGADFRGVRLIGTSLKGGTFVAANFENADLTAAQAVDAHFESADLRNIKAEMINLKGAKLNASKLQAAHFSKAICIGTDFKNAVVENVNFKGANLTRAVISGWQAKGADLSGANLRQVKINLKDLRGVRLKNTVFIEAEYNKEMRGELDELQTRGGILTIKDLEYRTRTEDLSGINLSGIDLREAKFPLKARFKGAIFRKTNLEKSRLIDAKLSASDFSGARMQNCQLKGAKLQKANFEGVDLSSANLADANLSKANFSNTLLIGANLCDAKLNDANLQGAELQDAQIAGADFSGADLRGIRFTSSEQLISTSLDWSKVKKGGLKSTLFSEEYTKSLSSHQREVLNKNGAIIEPMTANILALDLQGQIILPKMETTDVTVVNGAADVNSQNNMVLTQNKSESLELNTEQDKQNQVVLSSKHDLFIEAVVSNNINLVTHMLSNTETDIEKVDNAGNTALLHAAKNGHLEIIKLLLKNGADFNKTNLQGETALTLSKQNEHQEIVQILSKFSEVLILQNSQLSSLLKSWILYPPSHFKLMSIKLSNSDLKIILNFIQKNGRTDALSLINCEFELDKIAVIANYFNRGLQMSQFEFVANQIDDSEMDILTSSFKHNSHLTTLNVAQNAITFRGIENLSKNLISVRTLTKLNLSNNKIGTVGLLYLVPFLKHQHLIDLELTGIEFGSAGAHELSLMLKTHPTLVKLKLGYNLLYNEGTCYIAEALYENRILRLLDLKFSNVGDKGAQALIRALRYNKYLQQLGLEGNTAITEKSISDFKNLLQQNVSLTELNIENTSICSQHKQEIISLVKNRYIFFNSLDGKNSSLHSELSITKKFISEERVAINKQLLDAIGKEDSENKELVKNVYISRDEIKFSISDYNNYYTGDYMNVLLLSSIQEIAQIKAYSAIPLEIFAGNEQDILSQNEDYAFIPLNVAYDKSESNHKNHWIAFIIDKRNKLVFYMDPAQKTVISEQLMIIKDKLGYKEEVIGNPIDFQQKEKKEGWIRHCGPYVIEIFKCFSHCIKENRCISGSHLPSPDINHSISVQTALSHIPCGEAENIIKIRENHVDMAHNYLVRNDQNTTNSYKELLEITCIR